MIAIGSTYTERRPEEIQDILQRAGKSLSDFKLPTPRFTDLQGVSQSLSWKKRTVICNNSKPSGNKVTIKRIFNKRIMIDPSVKCRWTLFHRRARGTGKTFVETLPLAYVRSQVKLPLPSCYPASHPSSLKTGVPTLSIQNSHRHTLLKVSVISLTKRTRETHADYKAHRMG